MDMKRILQALDTASTQPVEGANDMKKFLSVVTEGANPHKVALPVQMAMQHYQVPKAEPVIPTVTKSPLLKKYFEESEEVEAQALAEKRERLRMYSQTIAERVLMKESRTDEIAGAFPSPSTRAKWAADAAASNRAEAGRQAELQRQANAAAAAKLSVNTADVDRLNKVNYSGTNAPTPSNASWDGDSDFLDLDGTKYNKASRMPISGDVPPDMKLYTTKEGRQVYMWTRNSLKGVVGRYFYPAEKPNTIQEAPIEMTGDANDPVVYGHEKANPMSLKGRIQQARNQLRELANMAESDDLVTWQKITQLAKGGMFMGLEQNLEQIRHGIEQLAAKRRQGGVASRGIDKNIGEDNDPCWKDYKQVGTKKKGGKTVPNCVPKE